ncbi:MAG: FlgD immunoglobulin-like domain containing protein [Bacteroidia bacterium]
MKKIYTIVALLALSIAANAQRPSTAGVTLQPIPQNNSLIPTDTLSPDADWSQSATLYNSVNGGYVAGVNGYGDLQKAQIFRPGVPVSIEGAIYWFGAKYYGSNSSASVVKMRVYDLDGTGTSSASASDVCPNTATVSDNVSVSSIDTSLNLGSAYIHTFSSFPTATGDFAVGFDLSAVNSADTIGLVSTTDPNSTLEDSWEQWSDGTWHSFLEPNNWGLNIALAIFPIVNTNVGVGELASLNGVALGVTGANPFTTNTMINYELTNNAQNVTITILDEMGRIVKVENMNGQAAGKYNVDINGENMAAGTYFVMLQADDSRIAVKVVKN